MQVFWASMTFSNGGESFSFEREMTKEPSEKPANHSTLEQKYSICDGRRVT